MFVRAANRIERLFSELIFNSTNNRGTEHTISMDGEETTEDTRMDENTRTERDDDPDQGESTARERIVDEITDVLENLYGTDERSDETTDDERTDDE